MNRIIIIVFYLYSTISFGQLNWTAGQGQKIEINEKMNHIHQVYRTELGSLILADIREVPDLNMLLVELDPHGNVTTKSKIGSSDAFERPVEWVSTADGEMYLLANVASRGKRKLMLYMLDEELEASEQVSIEVTNLLEATSMIVIDSVAHITVSIILENGDIYPSILKYDLTEWKLIGEDALPAKNAKLSTKSTTASVIISDENGKLVKDSTVIIGPEKLKIKVCNLIEQSKNNAAHYYLAGYENTNTVTDYWVSCKDQNNVIWEAVYPSKNGGDEARDLFQLESGYLLVAGVGYTKIAGINYQLKAIQIDKNGTLKNERSYKDLTRTLYKGAFKIGDYYAMVGQAEDVTYKSQAFEEDINISDVYVVLLDHQLNLVSSFRWETPEMENIKKVLAFNENEILIFYSIEEDYYTVKLGLN